MHMIKRWYYDSELERCKQFVYGGCRGNANNYETRDECKEKCLPDNLEQEGKPNI